MESQIPTESMHVFKTKRREKHESSEYQTGKANELESLFEEPEIRYFIAAEIRNPMKTLFLILIFHTINAAVFFVIQLTKKT